MFWIALKQEQERIVLVNIRSNYFYIANIYNTIEWIKICRSLEWKYVKKIKILIFVHVYFHCNRIFILWILSEVLFS